MVDTSLSRKKQKKKRKKSGNDNRSLISDSTGNIYPTVATATPHKNDRRSLFSSCLPEYTIGFGTVVSYVALQYFFVSFLYFTVNVRVVVCTCAIQVCDQKPRLGDPIHFIAFFLQPVASCLFKSFFFMDRNQNCIARQMLPEQLVEGTTSYY
mmetsp:Transcript_17721/g.32773  ORF Transcript_17721/g.32773 Transcript_17721/m.32773 type:complete len:153 (-) Transcript_17721:2271-2729(-)